MSKSDLIDDDLVQSDLELDDSDVVEPDDDPAVEMGDFCVEVTEEKQEAALMAKAKAMDAVLEGKPNEAIMHLTEAIKLNPKSAVLYASRATIFVKMKKPNAAIRDSIIALQIDPNSAKACKAQGMARALLGQWEEAANHLGEASKLDFDEETSLMMKKVQINVSKINEHRKKYKQLREEMESREAERERKKAEYASLLRDGEVIEVESAADLRTWLTYASGASRLAVVYFTSVWCGPSKFTGPLFADLAEKYPRSVFLKANIDKVMDLAVEWRVNVIPSFFMRKDGEEVDKILDMDMKALEGKIVQYGGGV